MTQETPPRFKLLLWLFIGVLTVGALLISRGCIQANERRHVKASRLAIAGMPQLMTVERSTA